MDICNNMDVIYPGLAFVGVDIFVNFCFLGHGFGSRYARKPVQVLKTLIKTSAKELVHWIGGQRLVQYAKKRKITTTGGIPHREPQTQNEKDFFKANQKICRIRTWFEKLSSSIDWRVAGLQILQTLVKKLTAVGLKGHSEVPRGSKFQHRDFQRIFQNTFNHNSPVD